MPFDMIRRPLLIILGVLWQRSLSQLKQFKFPAKILSAHADLPEMDLFKMLQFLVKISALGPPGALK